MPAESNHFLPDKTPSTYQCDLSLTQVPGTCLATWIERQNDIEHVCSTTVTDTGFNDVQRNAPCRGIPRRPKSDGQTIFWTEYDRGRGTLCCRPNNNSESPQCIQATEPLDCGDFAVLQDSQDTHWLLVEEQSRRMLVLKQEDDGWQPIQLPGTPNEFAIHPALCETTHGILAVWACYSNSEYRIRSALLTSDGSQDRGVLPKPNGTWEKLPALAVSNAGIPYAARCRERLIELPGGAANYTSELVVACLGSRGWQDVANVIIDHALNPWMAAYWGFRRYPRLASDTDGVWLLWEEKLDVSSMDPSLGRLCAWKITPAGPQGDPVVVLRGESHVVLESRPTAPNIVAATKTQPRSFMFQLPYHLHHLSLDQCAETRPVELPDNTDRPSFVIEHLPKTRAGTEDNRFLLFFGDPHVHSNLSYDLDPEPDEMYHVARDIAKLDFAALTENDATRFTEPLTPGDREYGWRLANHFNEPGHFTTFVGWEYTLHRNPDRPESYDSHRSVLYPGDSGHILSWADGQAPTPPDLAKRLHGQRVLLHHHHPCGFDITDDSVERNIEIASGWVNGMRVPEFVKNVHGLLDRGFHLGFIGASDNHERNPGLGGALTGIWAEENSRESLFQALRERRCFATTGLRPDLRFRVGTIFMGGKGTCHAAPEIMLKVTCDVPIQAIEIIRGGDIVHRRELNSKTIDLTWTDTECPAGKTWYYAHVRFAPPRTTTTNIDWSLPMPLKWNVKPAYGIDAWTSPIIVDVIP
ncbi:MAG: DUF3604 domain-containing protein [Candidatus Pacebacteria bacterium]|nr:DUF3604 domain-containing protein [Candidatus Paceibacterota bacterium]